MVQARPLMFAGAVALVVLGTMGYLQAGQAPTPARASGSSPVDQAPIPSTRAFVDKYCVTCHNDRRKVAGLALDVLDADHLAGNTDIWEKVVKKLHSGSMPPLGMPRPEPATYQGFIVSLESALDRTAAMAPNPGRPAAVHRLNRVEYANTIRDLLALEIDGTAMLPGDNSSYGFDNIGDVLTLSPGLLERYLLAARRISRLAVGDPSIPPSTTTYTLPYLTLVQNERMSEALPFGSRGGVAVRHYFPTDGEYTIKITLQRGQLSNGYRLRGLAPSNLIDVRLDRALLKELTVGGRGSAQAMYAEVEEHEDAKLEVRFAARAGMRTIGVTFVEDSWYVEGVGLSWLPAASDGYFDGRDTDANHGKIEMGIDKIDVTGPFNARVPMETPSRRRIFVCHPAGRADEVRCAREIMSGLARRAYRRPVKDGELHTLMDFFAQGRRDGDFDAGIQSALARLLTDPKFLFRIEADPAGIAPGTAYRVSDLELASRLSFFLWSSIPDDQLLDVAVRGRLRDPKVLEGQVRRMLSDERASALVKNFFGQWLLVRNLETAKPDPTAFPEFDDNLREAFARETQLFLETQLREDRPALDLLTANYTFVNERLARHYGLPNVLGSHFRRVTLPDDSRGGLLGQGSVLTVTSYNDRTSVVVRGKWILENFFGTPPPPPPANVPPLENTQVQGSLRQRMEQHRKNPVCGACHQQFDPMGFALENFDGIGKFRTLDGTTAVDASGVLVDGTKFSGPAAFRQALLQHRDAFLATLTGKLMTYALGRGVEPYDMPAVRKVVSDAAAHEHRWSALVLSIVNSMPFQMRSAKS